MEKKKFLKGFYSSFTRWIFTILYGPFPNSGIGYNAPESRIYGALWHGFMGNGKDHHNGINMTKALLKEGKDREWKIEWSLPTMNHSILHLPYSMSSNILAQLSVASYHPCYPERSRMAKKHWWNWWPYHIPNRQIYSFIPSCPILSSKRVTFNLYHYILWWFYYIENILRSMGDLLSSKLNPNVPSPKNNQYNLWVDV